MTDGVEQHMEYVAKMRERLERKRKEDEEYFERGLQLAGDDSMGDAYARNQWSRRQQEAQYRTMLYEWFKEERSILQWASPPPEVVKASHLATNSFAFASIDIDKCQVHEVGEDGTLKQIYAIHDLESAKVVAQMHRDLTDREVVVKMGKRNYHRLPAIKDREKFQVMPPLSDEEYATLKENIRQNGAITQPILEDRQGHIIDGHNRFSVWRELMADGVDLKPIPRLTATNLKSDKQKRDEALSLNMARRHLTREQKRVIVETVLSDTPDRADRWIADLTGVDHKTVTGYRLNLESNGEIPRCKKLTAKDGRVFTRDTVKAVVQSAIKEIAREGPRVDRVEVVPAESFARSPGDVDPAVTYIPRENSESTRGVVSYVVTHAPKETPTKPEAAGEPVEVVIDEEPVEAEVVEAPGSLEPTGEAPSPGYPWAGLLFDPTDDQTGMQRGCFRQITNALDRGLDPESFAEYFLSHGGDSAEVNNIADFFNDLSFHLGRRTGTIYNTEEA